MAHSACAYVANTAERPVAANIAQHSDPVITPAASTNAGLRPSRIATPMIAMLLGAGGCEEIGAVNQRKLTDHHGKTPLTRLTAEPLLKTPGLLTNIVCVTLFAYLNSVT